MLNKIVDELEMYFGDESDSFDIEDAVKIVKRYGLDKLVEVF